MISIGQYKMMPMAPNSSLMQLAGSKPKIGFSIDSIVGGSPNSNINNNNNNLRQCITSDSLNLSPRSSSPEIGNRPTSPYSDDCNISYPLELRNSEFSRSNTERNSDEFNNRNDHLTSSNNRQSHLGTNSNYLNQDSNRNFEMRYNLNQSSRSPPNNHHSNDSNRKRIKISNSSPITVQGPLSPESSVKSIGRISPPHSPESPRKYRNNDSPSAKQEVQQDGATNNNSISSLASNAAATTTPSKGPIVVPGIPAGLIRPYPVQHSNINDMKSIPSYMNGPEMPPNPHHILAAQFQMAAALAHHGQTAGGHGFPPGAGIPGHPHHPQFGNPNLARESYPLYPWLLSRHGRIFPHRFPGHFLLQPFRKPKRVRTAFSPTQLLKLEHAFEGNHYVVGAERKTLAQALSLTETQVKVWFQNRRTKHKRMQQEDDAKGSGNCGEKRNLNDCTQTSYEDDEDDDDELIDMDDCPSDQEMDNYH